MGDLSDIASGGSKGAYEDIAKAFAGAAGALPGYFQKGIDSLQPWQEAGSGALSDYQDFLDKLKGQANDPAAWMKDYQESPAAKFETDQALNAANTAAAGAGLLGGLGSRTNDMNIAQGIASKDMQNYFNNMMQQQGAYSGGLSDLSHMGLSGSTSIADLWKALGGDMTSLITGQAAAEGAAHQAGKSGKNSAIGGLAGGIKHGLHL